MEVILLPMVDEDLNLKLAFERMRTAGRSGIVWHKKPSEFRLFSAGQLAFAGRAKKLSDLEGELISVVDITEVAGSTPESYIDSERLHKTLARPRRYGLLAAGQVNLSSHAVLFANSAEDVLYLEPTTADCYCGGPPIHKIRCGSRCRLHADSAVVQVSF